MSCFKLTKHQCKKFTSAISSFWWNSKADKKKLYWVSWEKMCKSKKEGGVGFKDIVEFNQALLAKQSWRILYDPVSLVSRLYKSRYFPKTEIFDAGAGNMHSYAWRSMLFGRELLKKGILKGVGDGVNTKVWLDKWIFDDMPRIPYNKEPISDLHLKVSSLIQANGAWNCTFLHQLFPDSEVNKIVKDPPCLSLSDGWVWPFTPDGKYSVKSGCCLAARIRGTRHQVSVQDQRIHSIKARIWRVKTIPKIKFFMWRILSGALAVGECMQHHGIHTNQTCKICANGIESIQHVLFDCVLAAQVWSGLRHTIQFTHGTVSIDSYIEQILSFVENKSHQNKYCRALPWFLWLIWTQRNGKVFADKTQNVDILIAQGLEESEEWFKLQATLCVDEAYAKRQSQLMEIWSAPRHGSLKCNISVAWGGSNNQSGMAWILRDHDGKVILHAHDVIFRSQSKIYVEFQALLRTTQSLVDLLYYRVEIWLENSSLVKALLSPKDWPKFRT